MTQTPVSPDDFDDLEVEEPPVEPTDVPREDAEDNLTDDE